MRSGWKSWLLVLVMLTILWVLVLPNVDLAPATPVNVEVLLFAVFAFCMILVAIGTSRRNLVSATAFVFLARPPSSQLVAHIAPLRC